MIVHDCYISSQDQAECPLCHATGSFRFPKASAKEQAECEKYQHLKFGFVGLLGHVCVCGNCKTTFIGVENFCPSVRCPSCDKVIYIRKMKPDTIDCSCGDSVHVANSGTVREATADEIRELLTKNSYRQLKE